MYISDFSGSAHKTWAMPRLGAPQKGREAALVVSNPTAIRRHTISLPPDLTYKTVLAAREAGLSVSGLLAELVRRMEVDEDGRPLWADSGQGALIDEQEAQAS